MGLLSFVFSLVPLARIRPRPLLSWMNDHTSPVKRDLPIPLKAAFVEDFQIWLDFSLLRSSVPKAPPLLYLQLMTDASSQGWGGALLPRRVLGVWPTEYQDPYINWLELQARCHSLKHFRSHLQGYPILIKLENTTAVYCNRNQGT